VGGGGGGGLLCVCLVGWGRLSLSARGFFFACSGFVGCLVCGGGVFGGGVDGGVGGGRGCGLWRGGGGG